MLQTPQSPLGKGSRCKPDLSHSSIQHKPQASSKNGSCVPGQWRHVIRGLFPCTGVLEQPVQHLAPPQEAACSCQLCVTPSPSAAPRDLPAGMFFLLHRCLPCSPQHFPPMLQHHAGLSWPINAPGLLATARLSLDPTL